MGEGSNPSRLFDGPSTIFSVIASLMLLMLS